MCEACGALNGSGYGELNPEYFMRCTAPVMLHIRTTPAVLQVHAAAEAANAIKFIHNLPLKFE